MNGADGTRSAFSFRTLPQGGSSGPAHDERTNGSGCGATGEDRRGSAQPESCDVQSNEDYPRRPLTRARSRLSHVPLIPESGMTMLPGIATAGQGWKRSFLIKS